MFRCSTACDDETFLARRAASPPGHYTTGARGLTPPGSPRLQLELDVIQTVGRVIRKAEGKQIGTIVIPVFIDESEDADHDMDSQQIHFRTGFTGRETYGAVTPSSRFTSLVVLPRVSWIRVTNGSPL